MGLFDLKSARHKDSRDFASLFRRHYQAVVAGATLTNDPPARPELTLSALHKSTIKQVERVIDQLVATGDTDSSDTTTAGQGPHAMALSFSGRRLTAEAVAAIGYACCTVQDGTVSRLRFHVTDLDLSGCRFTWTDRLTAEVAAVTAHGKKPPNRIDVQPDEKAQAAAAEAHVLQALCTLLQRSRTLTRLDLSENACEAVFLVRLLTQGVACSPSLRTLNLRSVAVETDASMSVPDALCSILVPPSDFARMLSLKKSSSATDNNNNNRVRPPIATVTSQRNTTLRALDLSGNFAWSGARAVDRLVQMAHLSGHLTSLKLTPTPMNNNSNNTPVVVASTGQTLAHVLERNAAVVAVLDDIYGGLFKRQFHSKLNNFRQDIKSYRGRPGAAPLPEDQPDGEHIPAYKLIAMSEQKQQRLDPFKPQVSQSARWKGGYAMSIGRRSEMQDMIAMRGNFRAYTAPDGTHHYDDYWAVYDGHGGRDAANYAAEHLHSLVAAEMDAIGEEVQGEQRVDAIKRAFAKCNKQMASWCTITGTTVVAVYCHDSTRYTVNLGDSRAIIFNSRAEVPFCLTRDHRPVDPAERDRILAIPGGFVDEGRVNGKLTVSRSLGDSSLSPFISCSPDVDVSPIDADDEFMVLASDGLWDGFCGEGENVGERHSIANPGNLKMWNDGMREVQRIVSESSGPSTAAKKLCELAMKRGSEDNISVIVIFFKKVASGTMRGTTASSLHSSSNAPVTKGSDSSLALNVSVDESRRVVARPTIINPLFNAAAAGLAEKALLGRDLVDSARKRDSLNSFLQQPSAHSSGEYIASPDAAASPSDRSPLKESLVDGATDHTADEEMATNNHSSVDHGRDVFRITTAVTLVDSPPPTAVDRENMTDIAEEAEVSPSQTAPSQSQTEIEQKPFKSSTDKLTRVDSEKGPDVTASPPNIVANVNSSTRDNSRRLSTASAASARLAEVASSPKTPVGVTELTMASPVSLSTTPTTATATMSRLQSQSSKALNTSIGARNQQQQHHPQSTTDLLSSSANSSGGGASSTASVSTRRLPIFNLTAESKSISESFAEEMLAWFDSATNVSHVGAT